MLPSSPLARHAVAGANLGDRTAHPRGGRPHYLSAQNEIVLENRVTNWGLVLQRINLKNPNKMFR